MSDEIIGKIEYPKESSTVTRGMKIQGWAFSKDEKDVDLEIYLDDVYVKDIQNGIPRLDIEKIYPEFTTAYYSGFLTKLLMPEISIHEYHILEIIAKTDKKSISLGRIKIKLDTSKLEEVWPDEGMTLHFRKSGKTTFYHMNRLCNLKPNFQVLDIGCQLGRLAIPFTKFLNENGRYEGLDIIQEAISWCNENISKKYKNFHFTWANVFNGWYNPKGEFKPYDYKLPYEDNTFDFVIAYSVFTHMFRKETENYFSEISRVLKKGGKCWFTFTIIDDESLNQIKLKKTLVDLKYEFDGYRSTRDDNPESCIAWDEKIIKDLYQKNNLSIDGPIYPGHWRGISLENMLWQDVIVATKE